MKSKHEKKSVDMIRATVSGDKEQESHLPDDIHMSSYEHVFTVIPILFTSLALQYPLCRLELLSFDYIVSSHHLWDVLYVGSVFS